MLERLKNLNLEGLDIDEAIALSGFARGMKAEYDALSLETPEWLDTRIREVRREIKSRTADMFEKRLREAKARYETLKPTAERRDEVKAEIEKLEQMMAGKP